jgi:GNAT superfamily N-acetyltransferase
MSEPLRIRLATPQDIPILRELIHASVRGLQAQDYAPAQLEGALKTVYDVDSQLISDGTYFVAEGTSDIPGKKAGQRETLIVGCGGWSKRKTLYGGDIWAHREDTLLDPRKSAAKIRAFFVDPHWARHGIGSMILESCESAAKRAGFARLEMGATLTGVPFYRSKGYLAVENLEVPLQGGLMLQIVRMAKDI